MTSLRLVDRAIYSALVVDNAVVVCILEAQVIGALAKRTIHPERDLDVIGLLWAYCCRQLPEKSASAQHSKYSRVFGRIMSPLSLVANKYRPIHLTASARMRLVCSEKQAHWWTLTEISGLVDFPKKLNLPITLR